MNKEFKIIAVLFVTISVCCFAAACGGGGGGTSSSDNVTIEGTLASASASSRVLAAGEGGVPNITVAALGDSETTDENGNWTLYVDGNAHAGGAVEFTLGGDGVNTRAIFDDVAGGPGVTAYVDMTLEDDGSVTGTSYDEAGTILSTIVGRGALGCTNWLTFSDGGGNNLWKPVSESTGTVVILMPGEFRNADFSIHNANGDEVASVLKRHCCEHNGGRDHVYLSRSASSLAGEALPLTVRYEFSSSRVECLEVATPTWRLD